MVKKTLPKEQYTDIQTLVNKLKEVNKANLSFEIRFIDFQKAFKYSELPLHLIYNTCNILDLNLKCFASNQDDFDLFCGYFLCFQKLTVLKLRFYNKQISYLDSLFNNIVNIKCVELNLKNFKKIYLRSQFTIPQNGIEDLSINLCGVTFKDNESRISLENFITCQQSLKRLTLSLKKIDYLKFLLCAPKQIQMDLNLQNPSIDLYFCQELVKFKQEKGIEKLRIIKSKILIGIYLISQGIDVVSDFLKYSSLQFNQFTPMDMDLIDKVPYFIEKVKSFNTERLQIYGLDHQLEQIYKKVVQPAEYLYRDVYLSFHKTFVFKSLSIWNLNFDQLRDENPQLQNIFQCMVNVKLRAEGVTYFKQLANIMYQIQKNEYLIFYQYLNYLTKTLQYQGKATIINDFLTKQGKLISQRCLDRLRYFAFRKNVYDLIPLPQQVFFDLIDE